MGQAWQPAIGQPLKLKVFKDIHEIMVHAQTDSTIDWTVLRDFLDLGWPDDPDKLPPASLLRELLRTPRQDGLKPISPVMVTSEYEEGEDDRGEKENKEEDVDVTEIQVGP